MSVNRNRIEIPYLELLISEKTHDSAIKNGFVSRYDSFIDETNTETIETYFRTLAESFYRNGFKDGYSKAKTE